MTYSQAMSFNRRQCADTMKVMAKVFLKEESVEEDVINKTKEGVKVIPYYSGQKQRRK